MLVLEYLISWHEQLPDCRKNASTLTCFAQQIVDGWTRVTFESGEKRVDAEEEKEQDATSEKLDSFSSNVQQHQLLRSRRTASKFVLCGPLPCDKFWFR